MKQNRWIFYGLFALFHVSAFIFTIILDNNSSLLLKMVNWVWSFKWITFIGLLLLVIDVVWTLSVYKEAQKERNAFNHELNTLKAKLFDLQEASKPAPPTPPSRTNPGTNA